MDIIKIRSVHETKDKADALFAQYQEDEMLFRIGQYIIQGFNGFEVTNYYVVVGFSTGLWHRVKSRHPASTMVDARKDKCFERVSPEKNTDILEKPAVAEEELISV